MTDTVMMPVFAHKLRLILDSRAIVNRKYELSSRKLDMNGLREALYGPFSTRKLVFKIA